MPLLLERQAAAQNEVLQFRVPILEPIAVTDQVVIPVGIVDLATFRDWCQSDQFPKVGRIDYSRGIIDVDLSTEQLYDHNQVKVAIAACIFYLLKTLRIGRVFGDGARLVMPDADRSTEPDVLFVSFDSLRNGRVREIPGRQHGLMEFEGAPDLVVEVVSDSSVGKDLRELKEQYFEQGVLEYWIVDARREPLRFEILWRGSDGFEPLATTDGWQRSLVLGRAFQFEQQVDERGRPMFELLVRE